MSITVQSVRIESAGSGLSSFIDSSNVLHGYVASVKIYPRFNIVLIVKDKTDNFYLVALPDEKWRQDLIDDGYKIIFEVPK